MATNEANIKPTIEPLRPLANFPPSIWGDYFQTFSLNDTELEGYAQAIEEPKEDIRRLIVSPTINSNAKLRLINSVYRLGLRYLFAKEIEGQLDQLFKDFHLEDYDNADLYTTSVNFQVFRQHGYRLSCDVFNKFKDSGSGKFREYITSDVMGMLALYESTQLRIRGEPILDEAFAFTETHLMGVVDTLEGNLARQVKHALRSPFHRGIQMVEARLYFSNYEEECSTYDPLVKLAYAHFNHLQLLHKSELQVLTKWYKETDLKTNYPFARDRMPEMYLWILAIYFEPHYSQARIITTKIGKLVSILDDIYDAYGTIEELRLLTDALNRWEISAIEQLPEYTKQFYKVLFNMYSELEELLSKEGRENLVKASRKEFQELAIGYLQEAEWRHTGYMPSFEEYLKNGIVTSTYNLFARSAVVGMDTIASDEVFAWYESHPKIIEASELIGRLINDVMSFKFEGERTESVTGVHAYMKTFRVPESVAIDELMKMVENAWKEINEECLKPTKVPVEILTTILNLARILDVAYKFSDGYTFSDKTFKEYITLLLVAPVTM